MWSGQPGMDAGLAALGHGWPFAAGPRSNAFVQACRAWARHQVVGQERFGYFRLGRLPGFSKVTRRKGETISGRCKENGYTHRS
ncbi:hypothetical protein EMIT043CA1_60079 [Pseudomonas brassicacearum]